MKSRDRLISFPFLGFFARWRWLDQTSWSEHLCLWTVALFAIWTLCSNAVVFAGGSLQQLIALFAVCASVSVAIYRRWSRRVSLAHESQAVTPESQMRRIPNALRFALIALGMLSALLLSRPERFLSLWFGVASVLLIATIWFLWQITAGNATSSDDQAKDPETNHEPRDLGRVHAGHGLGLLVLALGCVALALLAHGSNADDSFYVSLAVVAVDNPTAPLMSGDPMHGVAGLPLYIPIYRAHGFEMLCAALAYLTGIPAIAVFHLLATCFGAFLVPLAYAALMRRLLPQDWLLATLILMIVLIAPGDAVRWYGNLAFVRMWQGKSLFLSLMTPLLYLYALRFAARPSVASWLALAAAQIAAIGFTSSAFWAAPVAVALGLVVGLRWTWSSLRPLTLGLLSSGYLVFLGLMLKNSVVSSVNAPPPLTPAERINEVFVMILGQESQRLWAITFAATALAWACVPAGLARRFALIVPLGAWLIFINPYLGGWVMAHVTHRQHWRSMWALPVPILITFLILTPLYLTGPRVIASTGKRLRRASCLLLAGLFALFIPRIHGLSAANGVKLKAPGLKVPAAYAQAMVVHQAFEPGMLVAAPPEVNIWLPTFHHRVKPLSVRFYLRRMGQILGEEKLRQRDFIPRLIVGDTDWAGAPTALRRELLAFPEIEGVVLPESKQRASYRQVLEALGYSRLPSPEADALDLDLWLHSNGGS